MVKNKKIIALLVLLIVISIATIVRAYTVTMTLTSTTKYLKEGDTITVNVNVGTVDAGDGIDTVVAKVDYDPNVFESVTTENVETWITTYAPSSSKVTIQNASKITEGKKIATFKFKVKDTLNVNSTTITFKEITASGGLQNNGGTGNISVENAKITFNKEATNTDVKPTGSSSIEVKPIDSTTSKTTKLPQTGVGYGIIAGLAAVVILSIGSYIAYVRIKKDIK